jgi:hypothetical protein
VTVPAGHRENGVRLDKWVENVRTQYSKRQLSPERVAQVEAIEHWSWTPHVDSWDEMFDVLRQYGAEKGNLVIPQRATFMGRRLGSWVNTQRTTYAQGLLPADRVARLESLPGWAWNARVIAWEATFAELSEYVAGTGNKNIPWDMVTAGGVKLAAWLRNQKHHCKAGQLAPQRCERLRVLLGDFEIGLGR